ncbi:alpha/beta hydrolase [Pontibacter diazotrophicus]|uniref:Alpha/beta hydrolase n=1 Tax=Pontibacter diazotrophicus TaxID=1400979 RepID=A0A3D8LGT0_9BACT|nr:alpha/beta hydrolase [Pontibacter diazotrophicus]RDV16630.1 alpha/beta hydrolase [Pontibacter diazotrophicus]
MKTNSKDESGITTFRRTSWLRYVRLFTLVGLISFVSACDDDDAPDIDPDGPRPEWGPTISDEMLAVIEALDSLQTGPPLTERTAEEARMAPTATDAVMAVIENNNIQVPPSQVDTTGMEIAVEGGTIHLTVYTPQNATAPYPGIVYYHGGGWVIAGIETYDPSARALAEKTGAVVVSVGYRQAPEYKFPTAHEDSFTAYEWVVNNAASINVDPDRIAVAGESAGGNLAAAVSMMARDRNVQMPVHQLLVYPIANYGFDTPSYIEYADAKPLSRPLMMWFFDKYLEDEADGNSPWISLIDAPNLQNLPPATIINAQIDPLQSEGQIYAERLEAAGVPVTAVVYEGVTHEFFGMAAVVPAAEEAQNLAAEELNEAFDQ